MARLLECFVVLFLTTTFISPAYSIKCYVCKRKDTSIVPGIATTDSSRVPMCKNFEIKEENKFECTPTANYDSCDYAKYTGDDYGIERTCGAKETEPITMRLRCRTDACNSSSRNRIAIGTLFLTLAVVALPVWHKNA